MVFFTYEKIDYNWWVALFLFSFAKASVPMFVLLSGYFLLGKEEPISHIFKSRMPKILLPLCSWTLAYLMVRIELQGWDHSYSYYFKHLIEGHVYYHMYFLYGILLLYLFLPLLRVYAQNASSKNYTYIMCVFFAMISVDFLMTIVLKIKMYYSWVFISTPSWFIAYFLLGYKLRKAKLPSSFLGVVLCIVGIIATVIGAYFCFPLKGVRVSFLQIHDYASPAILAIVIGLFIVISNMGFQIKSESVAKFVSKVSKATYGVYLSHSFINCWVYNDIQKIHSSMSYLISIPIIVYASFSVSTAFTLVVSKIPILNRLLVGGK